MYDSALVTDYNTSGNPIQTYLVDLSSLQERANLEVLVVFAGILLVLMMALTVERNRELVLQGRQLKFQAEHDALTGLFNRTTSEQVLADRFHKTSSKRCCLSTWMALLTSTIAWACKWVTAYSSAGAAVRSCGW